MKTNIRRRTARSLCRFGLSVLVFHCFLQLAGATDPSPEDQAKLSSLEEKGRQLLAAGKFAEAIPIAQEALELSEKALGPDHPKTAAVLKNLAFLYDSMGDYAKAEPLYRRAFKTREKAPDKISPLIERVSQLYQAGKFSEAIPIAQNCLEISEKTLGLDHPKIATSLNWLGLLYKSTSDYAKAELFYQRALSIAEKAPGADDAQTATILNNLAALYIAKGAYAKAEPLFQRSLKIREKTHGPDHPRTATALNNLAELYKSMGNYARAEPLFQRALKVSETTLGPEHPNTATSLNNLAELYREISDYGKAEPLYQRALNIDEKALGPEHPDTAMVLNNLATLYGSMGDYAKAELLYQRSLRIKEEALGPEHPGTSATLNNLAMLYVEMGDYAKAEPVYQRALKINEKALGADHPQTATALNNLAHLYHTMGEHGKAEPLFQRALKIDENALGPDHPRTAATLDSLAGLYFSLGNFVKAEPLFQRALKIRDKALGPESPDTATTLNNLALLYTSMGNHAKAEPLYQRSLEIKEKTLGPEHPATATALNNLAFLKIDLGQAKEAIPLVARARRIQERSLSNILSFTSEQQRLAFQKTTFPYLLPGTLGVAPALAQDVLRQKGVVLDSLLEDRLVAEASADPKQREAINQVRAAKQRLMQLVLEVPKDLSEQSQKERAAEKETLSAEVGQREADLARQVAGLGKARRALSVTVAQVESVLRKDGALVELLRYEHCLGNNKLEPRYGAVLISSNSEPKWVVLGSAKQIEEKIQLYRKSARGEADETTLSTVLKALQEQVWAPIEKALPPGTTTIIVSPDGELSFVSFATLLMPDDRFLSEKYSIRYVASGRDLLRDTKPVAETKTWRVFANPDFAANGTVIRSEEKSPAAALRSIEMRDLQAISLPDLPGTARESQQLEERARKSGWQAQATLGSKATEAELRKVSSPRILHLATHGFFLAETDLGPPPSGLSRTVKDIPKSRLVNPMHRSGLAVAGAQTTLQAWAKGNVPPTENDGIVTAEEVGGLKLSDTWLVALSACDTGGGEAKAGEGVMGLRRGFVQAGAQNLLMTLWPISDETTVQIMLDFYDAAFKSGNAPQALADTQRDWLVKLRKERGLLPAVQLAGPFIMSSQGKQ